MRDYSLCALFFTSRANGEESGRSSVASSAALAGLSRSKSFAGLLAGSSRRSSNSNSGTMNRESSSSNKRSALSQERLLPVFVLHLKWARLTNVFNE